MKIEKNSSVFFMHEALRLAEKAFAADEVPVGALLVRNNTIIARAYNQVEQKESQLAHAEIQAIQKTTKKLGDWRLDGCTLYVTLEPCTMCLAVIVMSRISCVVFGAPSKLYGFSVDKSFNFDKTKAPLSIEGGILENECASLLKLFFKNKREEKRVCKNSKNG